ncbi:MAG: hypothetical protein WBM17_02425 [Anaerolineales bacterium]
MSSKKAVFATGLALFAASLACTNPITSYFSTRTAVMQTATATMWTPTPTFTPTLTSTPTSTPTPTVDPRYYFETAGRVNFSYIPPDGWKKLSVDGTDLRGWSGPGDTELGFFDMKWDQSAEDAASDMTSQFQALFDNYDAQDDGVLDLESGADNAWFSFNASLQGYNVFITMYFFADGDNTAVYAMYFRTPGANENQDSVVLDSMNSFRFDE